MSVKVPEEKYRKTRSYRFWQWLNGTKDPYLDTVEMKPQEAFHEDEVVVEKRKEEKQEILRRVYDVEHNAKIRVFRRVYRIFCAIFCISLVFVLLTAVSHLPEFGNADNPVNNEVSERYIENGLQETGAVNIVTGMILDYRAFDTLGESHVLFIATCTVLILLRSDKKKGKDSIEDMEANDRIYEPKNDIILQTVARILVPPILIFGIYIILGGHLGPGGGFSGGAVIGAGLILYLNAFGFAKTERFFTAKTYKWMSFCALACYALAKSYSFYTGANHIESVIPLGTPGAILSSGLILLLNICVGIVVAGTMYTFYVTVAAIRDLIRYRKYNNPILSTSKVIKMAAALVSMLSLETAMFSQFGAEMSLRDQRIMIALTGAGVSIVVITMSIYIIVNSTKEIKRIRRQKI